MFFVTAATACTDYAAGLRIFWMAVVTISLAAANGYEIETTRKLHTPTNSYEKTTDGYEIEHDPHRTALANHRALYNSFEMDGNTTGRKGRPSFRALSQMGYYFVGNQKTPDSNSYEKTTDGTTDGYGIITTRKMQTPTNGYEKTTDGTTDGYGIIKTRKLHTPTNGYEKTTDGYGIITTRKLQTPTNGYEKTTDGTTDGYGIITTRKLHTPTYGYEKNTAEYNVKVLSRATKRISGYDYRKTNKYDTTRSMTKAQTSRITKDGNGNQGY